jgi:hypothetical protein
MPRFELQASVVLVASTAVSLFIFYTTRTKEGKIQLPTHVGESANAFGGDDPFDVTTEIDRLDGYPINADAFWTKVRSCCVAECQDDNS